MHQGEERTGQMAGWVWCVPSGWHFVLQSVCCHCHCFSNLIIRSVLGADICPNPASRKHHVASNMIYGVMASLSLHLKCYEWPRWINRVFVISTCSLPGVVTLVFSQGLDLGMWCLYPLTHLGYCHQLTGEPNLPVHESLYTWHREVVREEREQMGGIVHCSLKQTTALSCPAVTQGECQIVH